MQRLEGAHVVCGEEKEAATGKGAGTAKEEGCCIDVGFNVQ